MKRTALCTGIATWTLLAAGCGSEDDAPATASSAAGATSGSGGSGASAGFGGEASADEECPKQAGENPRPGSCTTVDNTCSVRDACGLCTYEADCDYYLDGPAWDYADPLQNTGRAECPSAIPVLGAACAPGFSVDLPPCEYCDGFTPTFRACLEGHWVRVTRNYCFF